MDDFVKKHKSFLDRPLLENYFSYQEVVKPVGRTKGNFEDLSERGKRKRTAAMPKEYPRE